MSYPAAVTVTEVGPRDGLQIEPAVIPTAVKAGWINALIDAGLPAIEYASFVSPKAVPQMADAAELIRLIERRRSTRLVALVPNARGAEHAAAAGVDEMKVFVSASESHNRKNVNRSVEASLTGFQAVIDIGREAGIPVAGAISTTFGCPFEGDIAVSRVAEIASRMEQLGMREIGLADTTGMATPRLVGEVCAKVRERCPRLPLSLHFHNTRGLGLVNVMAGLEQGVDRYESSFAGLGGCPFAPGATGNICTEDLINLLHELGIETGVDLDKLCAVAREVERVVGRPLPGQVMRAGPRLRLHPLDDAVTATG